MSEQLRYDFKNIGTAISCGPQVRHVPLLFTLFCIDLTISVRVLY